MKVQTALPDGNDSQIQSEYMEPHWYAVHTQPRHEKRVAEHFAQRSIQSFLPLYPAVHRWKDRRVQLELPLFPGYIFAHVALKNRLQVVQVPSVLRVVGFGPVPAVVPDREIDALRHGLAQGVRAEPHPYLKVGDWVRIKSGPFQGTNGVLVRKKDNLRVVLSVDLIMSSIAVEVEGTDIVAL